MTTSPSPSGAERTDDSAVRIGALVPLTRPGWFEAGQQLLAGLELAVCDVNDAGGIAGRPLELVVRDTAADPQRAAAAVDELARLAPENPEFMPAVGRQEFRPTPTFVRATANIDPEYRAQVAAYSIESAKKAGLVSAGYFNDSKRFNVVANSKGVFGFQELTDLAYTCTVRTEDGRGSGWVTRSAKIDSSAGWTGFRWLMRTI